MELRLKIYTDDTLRVVKREEVADRVKIPYRVSVYIGQSLDSLDIDNQNDLIQFVSKNLDKLDKIIKATFGVTDEELECIDTADLIGVGTELYKWGIDKIKSLRSGVDGSKN